jgi:hypothetical protein
MNEHRTTSPESASTRSPARHFRPCIRFRMSRAPATFSIKGKDVSELGHWMRCLTSLQVFSLRVLSLQNLSLLLSIRIPGKRDQVGRARKNLVGSQNLAVRGGQEEAESRYRTLLARSGITWHVQIRSAYFKNLARGARVNTVESVRVWLVSLVAETDGCEMKCPKRDRCGH